MMISAQPHKGIFLGISFCGRRFVEQPGEEPARHHQDAARGRHGGYNVPMDFQARHHATGKDGVAGVFQGRSEVLPPVQ